MPPNIAGNTGSNDPGVVVQAVDGKVVPPNSGGGFADVKLFSAMLLHDQAVVVAQILVPDSTNETICVKALLDPVDISGAVITGDSAHTRSVTASYVTGRNADLS